MSSVGNVSVGGVNPLNLQGTNLETAMVAVQFQRANLLESQMQDQMGLVTARNDQLSQLNQLHGLLSQAANGIPSESAPDIRAAAAGLGFELSAQPAGDELDGVMRQIKSQIDGMGKSQQADTQRLQSLTDKRNEAFKMIAELLQKMQESHSAIIANMR